MTENLEDFVVVDSEFGYTKNIETAYKVIADFETRKTMRFLTFYSKKFGKTDQGMNLSLEYNLWLAIYGTEYRYIHNQTGHY